MIRDDDKTCTQLLAEPRTFESKDKKEDIMNELHARMGANTSTTTILQAIRERQADVVGISAAMTFHRSIVADLIDRMRQSEVDVKILVGGQLFRTKLDLWQQLGADGYARDAGEAIDLAGRLVL